MMTLLNNAVNSTCWSSDFAQSPVLTTSKERGEGEKVSDKGTMTEEEYKVFLCNNTVCLLMKADITVFVVVVVAFLEASFLASH